MKFHTNLAAIARRTGYPVTEVAGWQARGKGPMSDTPSGVVCHHTAGSLQGDYPSLKTVTNGRSNLRNSLCAFGLGRSGRIYVVAAGRSWHAGKVNDSRFSNTHAFGIEAENNGVGERWSPTMIDAYARLCAELCRAFDIPTNMVRGHREICRPAGRKIDPAGINMNTFRAAVGQRLAHPTHQEDVTIVDNATLNFFKAMEDRINTRLGAIDRNSAARLAAIEAVIAADPQNPVTQEQLNKAVAAGLAGAQISLHTEADSIKL